MAAYLTYHKDMFGLQVQIVRDINLHNARHNILYQCVLTKEEAKLSIDELMERYPFTPKEEDKF